MVPWRTTQPRPPPPTPSRAPRGSASPGAIREDWDGGLLLSVTVFRETRRKRRTRSLSVNKQIKHRRGVRRWSVLVDARASPEAADALGQSPAFVQQLLQWLITSLQQLTGISGVNEDTVFVDVLRQWQACSPADLVRRALASDQTVYTPLASLVWHIVHILQNLQAHTSRCETLQWLLTATVWHLGGIHMARAYVHNVVVPTVLQTTVCGIRNISHMTIHHEGAHNEWYVSTEGSNFTELHMPPSQAMHRLHLCRSRCLTTSIPEIIACLGLEAVCWMFSSGSLARSVGVCNASCRLLVDHMASRGHWRGVNRTSILSLSGTLNVFPSANVCGGGGGGWVGFICACEPATSPWRIRPSISGKRHFSACGIPCKAVRRVC